MDFHGFMTPQPEVNKGPVAVRIWKVVLTCPCGMLMLHAPKNFPRDAPNIAMHFTLFTLATSDPTSIIDHRYAVATIASKNRIHIASYSII